MIWNISSSLLSRSDSFLSCHLHIGWECSWRILSFFDGVTCLILKKFKKKLIIQVLKNLKMFFKISTSNDFSIL